MQEHPTAEERVEQVQSLTGGYGADVVLEVTGVPAAFLEALQLARPGGRVVEIGNVSLGKEHEVSLAPGLITRKNLRVQGFVRYQPWYLHRACDSWRGSTGITRSMSSPTRSMLLRTPARPSSWKRREVARRL